MSSFFTVPGAQKKRKRATTDGPSRKRASGARPARSQASGKRVERDEEILSESGSDEHIEDTEDDGASTSSSDDSEHEETAAEKRLRLASQYLSRVRDEVDTTGFDAEEIDKDMIAARLEQDVSESKGKVFRRIASDLAIESTTHTLFTHNAYTTTSVAICDPFIYLVSKGSVLIQYRLQPLSEDQYPQTTRKKPKRQAPPRRKPQRVALVKGSHTRAKDKNYKGHVDEILCVAASHDGKFVATGGADRRLIIWSTKGLKPLRVFTHHRDAVTGLVFQRGTNTLYSASKDRTLKIFNIDALAYVETLFGHGDAAVDIDALAQERCISVGARDRTVRLWKVSDESQLVFRASSGTGADRKKQLALGKSPYSLGETGSLDRVAYIDDSHWVTGSDNGSISLWTTSKKKALFVMPLAHGLEDPIRPTVASSEEFPDATRVVPPPQPRWITSLCALPYSDLILSGSTDGYVRAWRFDEKEKRLEPVGILGNPNHKLSTEAHITKTSRDEMDLSNNNEDRGLINDTNDVNAGKTELYRIKGVINDLSIIKRGTGDNESLTVVAAVGKEHRLGSWSKMKGAKNGAVVFEIRRKPKKSGITNGINGAEKISNGD
ncbi:WD40 repeat-like protein [Xylariaceae sp. FL1651]|nr:WD40 repeat-like protein [Xylariaceae sp. FL1651]